jgi:GntR family transcriptional regulator
MTTELQILRIDLSSAVPAYEQVANGLRMELVAGRLQPGSQLPTVRQLALDLGIHHNTVAEAYRTLAREGWLDLCRGRGAMVLERQHPAPSLQARAEFVRRLRELAAKAVSEGVPRAILAAELGALGRDMDKSDSP